MSLSERLRFEFGLEDSEEEEKLASAGKNCLHNFNHLVTHISDGN